ncbi:TetR/AcrR family transcriptional regulator [Streptomyces cinnabarinus]|uniref:TetR/AcrR family transcriptional regulator n=1 Tax=Streptomyces cinnabarinus TaxID=67287 RepID=A0ABY7KGX2_9ACTN|nr:TetR/AcrR family transcriptional regulator [Streptomyces cinnabarinus]WAZ23789.1 TetR/AcrR family transcriptional regulator [Streptomyces cinnabarinus]
MTCMTAARTTSADHSHLGLRERKKIKTRTAIRDATYALIREQGYDATTVEQIAERAEVSPSTVFRYFPTKEDIVLTDEFDPLLMEEIRKRPADEPWMETLRHVMTKAVGVGLAEDLDVLKLRSHLMVQVPAVRSRMLETMSVTGKMLTQAIAERTGRDPESLEVRVYTMSLIGGLAEITLYWAEHDFRDDLGELLHHALDVIEHGLPPEKP